MQKEEGSPEIYAALKVTCYIVSAAFSHSAAHLHLSPSTVHKSPWRLQEGVGDWNCKTPGLVRYVSRFRYGTYATACITLNNPSNIVKTLYLEG
jgi:hypothetical protein